MLTHGLEDVLAKQAHVLNRRIVGVILNALANRGLGLRALSQREVIREHHVVIPYNLLSSSCSKGEGLATPDGICGVGAACCVACCCGRRCGTET